MTAASYWHWHYLRCLFIIFSVLTFSEIFVAMLPSNDE